MPKNLIVLCAGDSSLHNYWHKDFDLLINYYGNIENKYKKQCKYYFNIKGTKFNIVSELIKNNRDIFEKYDNFFIPDDDIYFTSKDLIKFFDIFSKYKLYLAQPSILGWWSLKQSLKVDGLILRYTNWVEMMCPCFSKIGLEKCKESFSNDVSCWGMEFMWNKLLNKPKNKIAIIDDMSVIHTRPIMNGDNYKLNKLSPLQCSKDWKKNKKESEYENFTCHGFVRSNSEVIQPNPEYGLRRIDKIWPRSNKFKSFATSLRNRYKFI
jgi:hypothetical protein